MATNGACSPLTIIRHLEDLQIQAEHVRELLQSPEGTSLLHENLHHPDELPDKSLERLAFKVVDSLERVNLELLPSVSLLTDLFFGFLPTKALWTVVEAGVPSLLHDNGPQPLKELGLRSGIQPERLAQLLDTIINLGVFEYDASSQTYRNNRSSELLRGDHWTQWHLWSDLYGNDFFDVSRSMPRAVRIGESHTAAQLEYQTDKGLFDYLAERGLAEKFHRTLGAGAIAQAKGLAVDYPFEEITEPFIDIGGGSGAFLASILRAHTGLTGSLMDLEHVVARTTPDFRDPAGKFADVGPRVRDLHVGDFMEAIPPAAVYTMKWCLHDWMDEDVLTIFKNVRRSITETPVSRFLVFESVKEPGRSSRLPRYGDLIMMITVNGKERSRNDWERLAAEGGWRVERIHSIRRAWPCAIDLRPI